METTIRDKVRQAIIDGRTSLGIELGSTRIKAVLIAEDHAPVASGSYDWENRLEDGIWTYHMDDVWTGLQSAYASLASDVRTQYGLEVHSVGAFGISAMMHGYLPFDSEGRQLAAFRTWRNTITEEAAEALTKRFGFNIPQRWSIAHLYQAILNGEKHVGSIAHLTTLAGYVHWQLTGQQVLGVGEASGMFPIDSEAGGYDAHMMETFDTLVADKKYAWKLQDILPRVLTAGDSAGELTAEGARLLDPSGTLRPGVRMCPPEGDAGTGMVATNSIAPRTGNVSAGTSIFAMIVLEKALSKVYTEIDMVTTPAGMPVAMVHGNNCTSDLDAWVKLFDEMLQATGAARSLGDIYNSLYNAAVKGAPDGGGLLSYNYYSGEPITGLDEGRPLLVRMPDSRMTLANFARSLLYSAMATLKIGMDILSDQERVRIEKLMGHGGLFKVKGVGQQLMASALNVNVEVLNSAGEGGAWGIALLAAYAAGKAGDESLEDYLSHRVFAGMQGSSAAPNAGDTAGFAVYMDRYTAGLAIERAAVEHLS